MTNLHFLIINSHIINPLLAPSMVVRPIAQGN